MNQPASTDLATEVAADVAVLLEQAWREPGFCVPNADTYPHQWLWDSCFHAITWNALGDERGRRELANVLAEQDESGFVPHMTYWHHPALDRDFWGRSGTSIITQPPMYGHAARVLHGPARASTGAQTEADAEIDLDLSERMARGLAHLLFDRPRTPGGLVPVLHPWETGCDDSPRWDGHRHRSEPWRTTKGELVAGLRAGVGDRRFAVGSIGFNALVVWNTRQYLELPGAQRVSELRAAADDLAAAVAGRWDPVVGTWSDDPDPRSTAPLDRQRLGTTIRTADTMLALLVDPRPAGFAQLVDPEAFGAPYGPRGVHVDEPSYRPDVYWRGPAWPQIGYLLWCAARAAQADDVTRSLGHSLVHGAHRSGWAEYWHPETGAGLGARPQTWAGIALPVARWLADLPQ